MTDDPKKTAERDRMQKGEDWLKRLDRAAGIHEGEPIRGLLFEQGITNSAHGSAGDGDGSLELAAVDYIDALTQKEKRLRTALEALRDAIPAGEYVRAEKLRKIVGQALTVYPEDWT